MQENGRFSGIKNIFFDSPYFLLLFLIIPVVTVVSLKSNLPVSGNLLLFNNGCFLVCAALRFVRSVLRLRDPIRYGADSPPPKTVIELDRPMPQLRTDLTAAGYRFDAEGRYAEKRNAGGVATTFLYGGLCLLLLFGSYDYMREYSIMVRIGVGEPMSLDGKGLVGQFEAGGLAATSSLPLLQVRKQILPNAQWPKGATEIALLSQDRKELAKGTIAPGKPFHYGGLEFHMTRFIYDALLMIRQGPSIVYESFVKFLPLPVKKGVYSHYGGLVTKDAGNVKGDAWLNPDKKAVLMEASLDKKKIVDTELELWGANKKKQGEYLASIEGLAQWSEIRVARGRHRIMLLIGAVFLILGGLVRLMVRPQRVWLEETAEGSRARAIGAGTLRLLQDKP